ncbi:unnamed protein product [Ilex paraguariensis]|uniref:Uncharacterized protein n=1 Tax=Ilex paraguariensis TaxID=185542 RepID=A0ABC8T5I6_9AQUA
MRGYQGVYDLEKKMYEAAVGSLVSVQCPLPVKFSLPNPQDPFSLKPGSISKCFSKSKAAVVDKSSSLSAAIAAARGAATQFSKKAQTLQIKTIEDRNVAIRTTVDKLKSSSLEEDKKPINKADTLVPPHEEQRGPLEHKGNSGNRKQFPHMESSQHQAAPSKIFAAALRGLRPA